MYLYYDNNGVLREIINDESLRQGNYGVNTVYVYVEGRDLERADVSYLMPDDSIAGPIVCDDFEDAQIPFDRKRDLKHFRYYTTYHFLVIDLSAMDSNGKSALDQAGVVHCNMELVLTSGNQLVAGDFNFVVELNPTYNQKQVASQEYLSLADYLYLKKVINLLSVGIMPDGSITSEKLAQDSVTTIKIANGAVTGDKIADGAVTTLKIAAGAVSSSRISSDAIEPNHLQDRCVTARATNIRNYNLQNLVDYWTTEYDWPGWHVLDFCNALKNMLLNGDDHFGTVIAIFHRASDNKLIPCQMWVDYNEIGHYVFFYQDIDDDTPTGFMDTDDSAFADFIEEHGQEYVIRTISNDIQ